MASGQRLLTTTQDKLAPKVIDTVLNSNVLFTRIVNAAKSWRGEQMKFPIKYEKNTTGQSFAGFDTFSTAATNNRVNLAYNAKFYQITVSLPLDELSINATQEKVIDLATVEMKGSADDMADDLGTIFYADGTGNSSKDPLGLAAIVDDGSSVANIGGLARATYATLASTVTASGGTLTLAKMATLYNDITSGSQKPTVHISDQTVFSLYEQLLQPQERINKNVGMVKGLVGGTGFTGLDYKGVTLLADEKATAQTLFMMNESYLDWYGLTMAEASPIKFKSQSIEGNDYSNVMGLGFSWSEWVKPSNAAALIGHIYFGGEFITDNPKRHARLTGITGV